MQLALVRVGRGGRRRGRGQIGLVLADHGQDFGFYSPLAVLFNTLFFWSGMSGEPLRVRV